MEWFHEIYRLKNYDVTGGYVIRDDKKPVGVAINLDIEDEFGSGGQLCLSSKEITKVYPILKQFMEECNG